MPEQPYFQELSLSLAATGSTGWFELDKYHNAYELSWPGDAGNHPEGALGFDLSNDPSDTKTVYSSLAKGDYGWTDPAGTGAGMTSFEFDTAKKYGRINYTHTAGGTDLALTIRRTAKD